MEKKSNFAGFSGTKSRKKWPISREFRGNFRGKLGWKAIGKKTADFVVISLGFVLIRPAFLMFFLTEVMICSFNKNTLQK